MVLALRTLEHAVKPLASLSPGRDPQRPISAQTNWCRVRDFHPQPLRSERSVSCSWTNAAKWYSRQPRKLSGSPATATFEASRSDTLSYGSIEIGGSPRICTEFSPVKSRDFTVKVCNPNATRRRILPCGTPRRSL
jgi:hypothetical protein